MVSSWDSKRKNRRKRKSHREERVYQNGIYLWVKLDYLFCCNGDKDIAYEEHKEIMDKAEKCCPQLVRGKNYDFFIIPGGVHDMKAWQLHLYHALQIFF